MRCPYLAEVTMVFCRMSPQKKLIPSDRIATASACEAEGYHACPLYRAAVARAHGQRNEDPSQPGKKGQPS